VQEAASHQGHAIKKAHQTHLNMRKLNSNIWPLLGIILGATGGYLYWRYVGCLTGTCPLKSHWQTMIPFGALGGYVGFDLLQGAWRSWRKYHSTSKTNWLTKHFTYWWWLSYPRLLIRFQCHYGLK
jgi:hypothetical protein